MKISCAILLVLALALTGRAAPAAASAPRDNFDFTQAGHHVKVWYHAPAELGADAPVVFVMHGVGRNGEDYRNNWTAAADAHRFLLVVPEFSKAEFPGDDGYNYGNTVDKIGAPLPREPWSFNMIEPIFDAVRTRLGSRRANYLIFGHSAGAQFVQRLLYFVPAARATHVIAANAGWYMMPELGADFPYGLKGTPMNEAALRGAFARPMVVLLGEADTDANHMSLRHSPESDAQGLYRFARGQFFFAHARETALGMKTPFQWTLATAPGIAHSNKGMAPFAVHQLFPD